jgi:hypothetical protein
MIGNYFALQQRRAIVITAQAHRFSAINEYGRE